MTERDIIQESERVLADLEAGGLKLDQASELENDDLHMANKTHHLKNQFVELKRRNIELEGKMHFLKALTTVGQSATAMQTQTQQIDEDWRRSRAAVQELKDRRDEIKENVEGAVQRACHDYEQLRADIPRLRDLTRSAAEKAAAANTDSEQIPRVLRNVNRENMGSILQGQADKLRQTEAALRKPSQSIEAKASKIAELKKSVLKAEILLEQSINDVTQVKEKMKAATETRMEWCAQVRSLLTELSGIREHSRTKESATLEILGQGDSTNLLLTLHFKENSTSSHLTSAEVNVAGFEIADFTQRAIEKNDIQYLVHSIKSRWLGQQCFWSDLSAIRDRFAVDWLQSEGLLKAMFGDSGQIVVTLRIDTSYPAAGSVTLHEIKGHPGQTRALDPQTLNAKAGIVELLEHLQQVLANHDASPASASQ